MIEECIKKPSNVRIVELKYELRRAMLKIYTCNLIQVSKYLKLNSYCPFW